MGENPELIAMARRICAEHCANDEIGRIVAADFLSGQYDDDTEIKIALAAIIETTEAAAVFVEGDSRAMHINTARRLRRGEHIRSGQHYGKDHHHD